MSNGKGDNTKCSECGMRRRGTNHNDGQHHIRKTEERKKALGK